MSSHTDGLYAYPEPNTVLIQNLNLLPHPEGQQASPYPRPRLIRASSAGDAMCDRLADPQ